MLEDLKKREPEEVVAKPEVVPVKALADELNEIALRCASRPVVAQLSEDEVLGYDGTGVPSR